MAKKTPRTTLAAIGVPVTVGAGISADAITHNARLALGLSVIAALVAITALYLILRTENGRLEIKEHRSLAEDELQKRHFEAVMSSPIFWRFFPKQAAARSKKANNFRPLTFGVQIPSQADADRPSAGPDPGSTTDGHGLSGKSLNGSRSDGSGPDGSSSPNRSSGMPDGSGASRSFPGGKQEENDSRAQEN